MRRLLTTLAAAALLAGAPPANGQSLDGALATDDSPFEIWRSLRSPTFDVDALRAAVLFDLGRLQLNLGAEDYLELAVDEPFGGIQLDAETPLGLDLALSEGDFDTEQRIMLTVSLGW